jgi:transposase
MKLEEIGMTIPLLLNIANIKIEGIEINNKGEVVIKVESTKEKGKCHQCEKEISEYYGEDKAIRLRHFPMLGHKVYIEIKPKRYICKECKNNPTSTQELEWYKPKSTTTKEYEKYLLLQIINSTIEDVSIKNDIGYKVIEAIIEKHISKTINWDEFEELKQLGLDEIALKKGHKDQVAIITTRSAKTGVSILAVLEDKKKETVKKFLETIPERLKKTVKIVCTDMYEGFVNAAKEVFLNAKIVIDRYHVAKTYRNCTDDLRKKELKRLKKELPKEQYDEIKGAMWPFRKKRADLEEDEVKLLDRLFTYSPALKQAYDFRNQLTDIFEKELSKSKATKQIKNWKKRVSDSGLKCFDSFFTTLDNWIDEITNYFTNRFNSGFVEGFNNKLKVIKRRCYGISNIVHFFQRAFLDSQGYKLFASISC